MYLFLISEKDVRINITASQNASLLLIYGKFPTRMKILMSNKPHGFGIQTELVIYLDQVIAYLNFSFFTYKMGTVRIPLETSKDFARLYEIMHMKALASFLTHGKYSVSTLIIFYTDY